jgi:hypothetical protein
LHSPAAGVAEPDADVDVDAEVVTLGGGGVVVAFVDFVESCSEFVQALRATAAASATVTMVTLPAMRMASP